MNEWMDWWKGREKYEIFISLFFSSVKVCVWRCPCEINPVKSRKFSLINFKWFFFQMNEFCCYFLFLFQWYMVGYDLFFSMIMIIVIWYALLNIVHLDHEIMSMHVLVVYYVHMYWIDLYQLILYSQDPIVYSIHVQVHLQHEISNIVHVDHIVVQPIIDNVIIKLS